MLTLGAHLTRQDASLHYRRWEIAGAAHTKTPRWVVDSSDALDRGPGCKMAVNAAPHHAVVKAGFVALTRWVRDGVVPRQSPNFCFLYGTTELLDPATLAGMYPTHDAFVTKFNTAADVLVRDGYWLQPEAEEAKNAARRSAVG